MTSLNIQNITLGIMFILRFKGENVEQTNEFLLTDDLRTVQLQNFYDIFQRNKDHTFSRFRARNYDFESDYLVLKEIQNHHQSKLSIPQKHHCNCLICFGIEKNREFREIQIPVSKTLFLKVINFSIYQDSILSTREVYDTIYNLFMILDNTNIIACLILKQLLADEELFDNMRILHKENVHSLMNNYQGTLEAKSIEMVNQEYTLQTAFFNIHRIVMEEFIFVYKDEHDNVALTTSKGDNKRKPHVVVDINLRNLWNPFSYLKIDSAFIHQNCSLLKEILYKNDLFRSNVTLDIDFTKFYQRLEFAIEINRGVFAQSKVMDVLLPEMFKHVGAFRLRLSEMTCSIDFRFFCEKKITLFCNNVLFTASIYFPQNLWGIYIHDSGIEGSFTLPASTKVLSVKKVIIDIKAKITINHECLRIEIENTSGDIDVPNVFGIYALSFNKQWKKCHILRSNTGIIKELAIAEAELFQDWIINMGVKKIWFEDIETEGPFSITINADCENISLKNCTGVYNLVENALLSSLGAFAPTIENEFHLSNENGQYRLNIVNVEINHIVTLNEKIKTIVFEDVYIQGDNVLSIHICRNNISLKNCVGSFDLLFGTSIRRISLSQTSNYFSSQFNENTGMYKMSFIGIVINASWALLNELEDFLLESFTNENNEHFEIKEGCNKMELINCNGPFKIPGIQVDNHNCLKLDHPTNKFSLTKLPGNLFLLHMSDIFIHQTIHILPDIWSGRFERVLSNNAVKIRFEVRCEVLFLINCDVLFDQPATNVYQRLILNKMFEIDYILKVQTKELFMNSCKIIKDVQLGNTLYTLHFYDVEVLEQNTVSIPKQCINVFLKNCLGAFMIPGWNEHEDQVTMFFRRVGDVYFFRYNGNDHYLLKIDNCSIDGRICIRKDIKDIILSNITLTTTCSKEKIDEKSILNSESLQSLTLKSSSFLYNATIYKNLIYLYLEGMYFNHDVVMGVSIKKLTLKDVTIEANSSVALLGKGIFYFEICNFNGMLNFNDFLNLKELRLWGSEKIVYERVLQTENVYLKIENLTFASDYRFPADIKVLYLTNIKTRNSSRISVNKACEEIITNFEGKIYFMKERRIEKAVFINRMPLFEPDSWTFDGLQNIGEVKMPSHLKNIRLEDIKLSAMTIKISEGCKDISIVHCACGIDLSEILRLSKLTLHPDPFARVFLSYPNLRYIQELDLAFNFVGDFIEHLLCSCFNVRILTLRALTFVANNSHWLSFLTSDAVSFLSLFENFHLSEIQRSLNENFFSEENTSDLWALLNERINILMTPIFNTRSQFKLEVLKITGFYLTNKNLKRLSNFSIMRKLSVDYNFVSIGLFEHLPPNLETLEILSSEIFESDNKNSMKNTRCAEAIKNIMPPKMLIMEGFYFETMDNFFNLPQNLHTLKIAYHDLSRLVYEPIIEKIRLRKLVVFFKLTKNNVLYSGLTSIEKKICIKEMFRYLNDFIDFSKLDSLMMEDCDEKTEYDPFEIY